jgi:multiple sugar transport system substrate-binding protein
MHKKLARSCMAAGVVSCMGFAGLVAGGSGVASASANVKRVPDGTTTITVWTYWNQKFYPAIEKQFDTANPGLSIKFEPIPLPPSAGVGSYPLFTAKLKTAEISHSQPNLILEDQTSLGAWVQEGLIEQITPSELSGLGVFAGQFPKQDWGVFSLSGKQYGVPVDWDPDNMLYYNKIMMQKAGIKSPPTTFSQLAADAKLETTKSGSRYATMGFVPWAGYGLNNVGEAHMYGGTPIETNGTVTLKSPAMVAAESFDASYAKEYGPVAIYSFLDSVPTGADPFQEQKLGFMVDGDWELSGLAANAPKFTYGSDWGIATAPLPPGGNGNDYLASGWGWTIPTNAPNLKDTLAALKYMTSLAFVKPWNIDISWLPANTSDMQSLESTLVKAYPGFAPFIKERTDYPNLAPEFSASAQAEAVGSALATVEDEVTYLKQSPTSALAAAQQTVDSAAS